MYLSMKYAEEKTIPESTEDIVNKPTLSSNEYSSRINIKNTPKAINLRIKPRAEDKFDTHIRDVSMKYDIAKNTITGTVNGISNFLA
ncbi:hypothetical protein [Grimontia celer]|uniref:hypothetical protein n=1 Tax=Grimontia celer TaxID=1796497 RepID=UPI000786B580|nr:hypothetical protein [Grimontia celer]